MINIDSVGNISCCLNDRILLEYKLMSKKDKLQSDDRVKFYYKFNDDVKCIDFIPVDGIVYITVVADTLGDGMYRIEVVKNDGRIETTNLGTLKVYEY